jgi:hypothetical protein
MQNQKQIIADLSSKILYLTTMFKSMDLITYHGIRKEKVKVAFLKLKLYSLQREKKEAGVQVSNT